MSFLQIRDVSHGYTAGGLFSKRHRVDVLRGLNLELIEGQNLGLLGSSGSGKSTLARLLMGLESIQDDERPVGITAVFRHAAAGKACGQFLRFSTSPRRL